MFMRFVLVTLAVVCLPGLAAAEVGFIKRTTGEAFIERGAEQVPAEKGFLLEASDVLVTGAGGRISVTFADKSRLSVGPDSRVVIEEFEFDPVTHDGKLVARIENGDLAIVSGQIAKENPDAMKIRTPTSILGVRGTRLLVQVSD